MTKYLLTTKQHFDFLSLRYLVSINRRKEVTNYAKWKWVTVSRDENDIIY